MDGLRTEVCGQHKQSNDPRHIQHNPRNANHWAPRTRKRHQQEQRPQRPTERSDPTQHAKGRTGDCPGPRKETTTRRNVTRGGGGGAWGTNSPPPLPCKPMGMCHRPSRRLMAAAAHERPPSPYRTRAARRDFFGAEGSFWKGGPGTGRPGHPPPPQGYRVKIFWGGRNIFLRPE